MARIFTRKWFWILLTTLVPALWQVLSEKPADEAAANAEQARAVATLCQHLDPKACR